jgi:hypothetical protein
LVMGVLLAFGVVHDVAVYVAVILILNMKVILLNCGKRAPYIRMNMEKLLSWYARAKETSKTTENRDSA